MIVIEKMCKEIFGDVNTKSAPKIYFLASFWLQFFKANSSIYSLFIAAIFEMKLVFSLLLVQGKQR